MLYREIIAVCSQIHTKHINTVCGQKVELLNVKLAVHIVTTGLWRVKCHCPNAVTGPISAPVTKPQAALTMQLSAHVPKLNGPHSPHNSAPT